MRESWTDERLDDFASHVDKRFDAVERQMEKGFSRVDEDIRGVRAEVSGVRGEVAELRRDIDSRFDALQRTLLQVGGGLIGTFAVAFLGLIATQL